jgi:L-alanine-DL-glutamate epimerase-like enolase superfamily enzyme
MTIITNARAYLIDIPVETPRTDAVQSFLKQETIFVHLQTSDGLEGVGYSYTIGTGGTAVLALLKDYLLEMVVGMDSERVEHIWNTVYYGTRATTTGAITSLAVAAIDTALWDLRGLRNQTPLWKAVGGFSTRVPLYDTEGGWLHIDTETLVAGALESQKKGWSGVKLKIGKPSIAEDLERLQAVRNAVGPDMDIMVDANQSMTLANARQRAEALQPVGLFWLEEPMPADDIAAHSILSASTSVPIAVGESIYSAQIFQQYLHQNAASVIQVDVARVGGITPWLKVAHLAETYNVTVCPHFLMELHVSLAAGIPNGGYVERIPQLTSVTTERMKIENGAAVPPDAPGLGIPWDFEAIEKMVVSS